MQIRTLALHFNATVRCDPANIVQQWVAVKEEVRRSVPAWTTHRSKMDRETIRGGVGNTCPEA